MSAPERRRIWSRIRATYSVVYRGRHPCLCPSVGYGAQDQVLLRVKATLPSVADYEKVRAELNDKIERIKKELKLV